MNPTFENILNHPVMESLGWVLLHFLWEGAAVAVVLFLVLTVLRRVSANARYLISCFALLMTATLPAITWTLLPEPLTRFHEGATKPVALAPSELQNWTVSNSEGNGVVLESFGIETPYDAGVSLTPPAVSSNGNLPQKVASILEQLKHWLRPWIPFLTCAWLAGVLILSTRLLFTWIRVQRLQQRGVQSPRPEHQALLQRLASRLKISRTVRLLESIVVEVPTVIGWLKPVILLPVASVNSLTVPQLEAILAHELAHIRRADYAVNLVQSLIETLLFYHPAVWWMSARIRQEREHCCDDLATSISGDAASYVAALVRMEELRCEPRSVAVAARGGDLLTRAKRLLVPSAPDRLAPRWLTGVFAMAIAAMIVCVPLLKTSQAEPATAQDAQTTLGNTPEPTAAADEETAAKEITKKDPEAANLDEITPAEIADRIEEARKRYASVEYTATIEQTRNTSAFRTDAKPTLVKGTGSVVYRADGERWFCDRTSFSYQAGSAKTYPTQTVSSFDGSIHRVLDGNVLKICEEDNGALQYAPTEFFWKAGISSNWLLSALRRPEAKLIERIQMAETSCLNVTVEWKPASESQWSFDIMICPEQDWLVRRVTIELGGQMFAEWSISEVAKT
jgi:beta-lactamase regulating signal transducer with metallopeptidase domain